MLVEGRWRGKSGEVEGGKTKKGGREEEFRDDDEGSVGGRGVWWKTT